MARHKADWVKFIKYRYIRENVNIYFYWLGTKNWENKEVQKNMILERSKQLNMANKCEKGKDNMTLNLNWVLQLLVA